MRKLKLFVIAVYVACIAASALLFRWFAAPAIGHVVANGDLPYWVHPSALSPAEDAAIRVFAFPFAYVLPVPLACLLGIVFWGVVPAGLVHLLVQRWWRIGPPSA